MRTHVALVLIALLSLLSPAMAALSEEAARHEAQQVALWKGQLAAARQKPTKEAYSELWLGLRNMAYRRERLEYSSAVDEIFGELQQFFLSKPGHAQYFVDALREEREAELRSEPNYYEMHRVFYIKETLPHLPSPETIRVLGEFLSDDLDKRVRAPGSDFIPTPANSVLAAQALSKIGLRNAPLPRQNDAEEKNLAPWREWWAKVKSGEHAFSFEKQEVEYVFQADGSVASRPRNGAPRPRNAPVIATPVVSPAPCVTWPYWLSGGLVAVAAVWWMLARRSGERSKNHPE